MWSSLRVNTVFSTDVVPFQVRRVVRARGYTTRSRADHGRRRIVSSRACSPITNKYANGQARRIFLGKCFRVCPRSAPIMLDSQLVDVVGGKYVTACALVSRLFRQRFLGKTDSFFASNILRYRSAPLSRDEAHVVAESVFFSTSVSTTVVCLGSPL